MVDALNETSRVLRSGAVMVDLRPVATDAPVDIVDGDRVESVGRTDGSPGRVDDVASDRALGLVVRDGRFRRERQRLFDFCFYWDDVDEMATDLTDDWQRRHLAPAPELIEATRTRFVSGGTARLRSQEQLVLTTYRNS